MSLQGDLSAPCPRAALLLTMFSLLWEMLSCKRSFKKHFPVSLKQSDIGTGGESFLSSVYVKILSRGLLPCCQTHMTVPLDFFQSVRQLPSNSDPKYLSYFWGVILKAICLIDLSTRENSPTLTWDTKLSHPSKPATAFDLWRFVAFLLCSWRLGERCEKWKGGRGVVLELSWAGCSVELLLFRSPEVQFSLLPALSGVGMSTCPCK